MQGYEGIIDLEINDIKADIQTAKELTKMNGIISTLSNTRDSKELTRLYTDILDSDNVSEILITISKEKFFLDHFPEFYEKNIYGENIFNCTQNSEYHRYGVFKHILVTIEEVGKNNAAIADNQRKILKWTMFLHDLGKPYVKIISDLRKRKFYWS
jgi:hypothetical protein